MNLELLPEGVHRRQDEVIPMLLRRAIFQKNGGKVDFGTHANEMLIFERARLARDIKHIFDNART